jgi:hypothetical protein
MLEIILLINFGKKLAELARGKGRSPGWAALGVAFWFGGEIVGFILASLLGVQGLPAYGVALAVAGVGVFVAHLVVKNLPQLAPA